MSTAGYSSTPLIKKLGIKAEFVLKFINIPENYFELLGPLPEDIILQQGSKPPKDFIHFFTKSDQELKQLLPSLKKEIKPNGMIWVSWPKKSSKIQTDLSENDIRNLALEIGLVDIKVCAIDHIWSGLKLVIPVKDR